MLMEKQRVNIGLAFLYNVGIKKNSQLQLCLSHF